MLERAQEVTRSGHYTALEYCRWAEDLVVLVDAHPRHDWLVRAVTKRLGEEVAKLQLEINIEKSRLVDLSKGESFDFLGVAFRWRRSRQGKWRPHYPPKLRQRTARVRKLKEIFRRFQ